MSPNETYPQHVVTAVIVAHDGAAWLPRVIQSLLDQTRPLQRVVAVDTGSRDRSGSVLSGLLGQGVVFGMDRGTGYGAAVTRALQHRAANASVPGAAGIPGGGERVEWVWLLHDDSEPAPDALEQLLRGAAETRSAAVLGPKLRDWSDRQVILEAGITIDTVGRRITGIEPREVDQGQHDGDRDTLAVGSAGMLVRRDVWDLVGGFDTGMPLFREDVDFCWRVHAAGYRVRVITDAIVYHVEASARRRRPISVARRPHQLDRRNAMLTLIGNLPGVPMLASAAGSLTVSIMRALFFLVAKRLAAALDELAAVGSVLGHPVSLLALRRRRARGRRAAYGRLRRELPPGRSLRRIAEFAAAALSKSGQVDTAGTHHATDDPDEADFLLTDTGIVQRVLTNPGVLVFLGLTVVSLIADRALLGSGPLGGGALVPAWGGAADLWHEYLQGFHPVGIGSGSSAPPYLAIMATLATLLGGKPWLAVDVILLGCVPLAGICAFLAVRKVTRSTLVRVWAAASYALLPAAMGAIAAGRIGTAVGFVLVPVIALLAGRMLTQQGRRARRAAWATALAVAIAAAFVPLVWVVALAAALAFGVARPAMWRNLGIVAVVPPVLLVPWTFQAAMNPAALLLEVGVQQPGLAAADLSARSLMLLSPGGPGLPPAWVTAGIGVAAVAALLLSRRRALMMAGWGIALSGLLAAVAVSRTTVTPAAGEPAVSAWPGVALLIAATGLLLAGATAGDALPKKVTGLGAEKGAGRMPGQRGPRTLRGTGAVVLAIVASSAPVLAAASWMISGVRGPVGPVSGPVVPAVVSVSSSSGLQARTLVLRSQGGQVSYSLQRGTSPSLGDPDLAPVPAAQRALTTAVAALVAPNGGEAVDQGQQLAHFDIGFVLLPAPVDQGLARLLSGVAALRPVSATSSFDLWRVTDLSARVLVAEPNGTLASVRSGQVGASAPAPAAGGTIELAEPIGGWEATLNGKPLTRVASPAGSWAQAFRLPAGGGTLDISHKQTGRDLLLVFEVLAVLVVAVLALPGSRTAAEDSAPAAAGSRAASRSRSAARAASGSRSAARAASGSRSAARAASGSRSGAGSPSRAGPRSAAGSGAAARAGAGGPGPSPGPGAEGGTASGGRGLQGGRQTRRPLARAARGRRDREAPQAARRDRRGEEKRGAGPARGPDTAREGGAAPREGGRPAQRSAWPGDGQDGRRAAWPADEPSGAGGPWQADAQLSPRTPWPSDDQGGWPAPQQSSGWPSGGSDVLDPLPPAGDGRYQRPRSQDDEESAGWPVRDPDSGGDIW